MRLRELERDPLEIAEVDLAATARDVAAELGASDRVAIDIPEGTVAADRRQIVEILTELLDEALRNAPGRSPVTVCADSDKSGLRLWIGAHGVHVARGMGEGPGPVGLAGAGRLDRSSATAA